MGKIGINKEQREKNSRSKMFFWRWQQLYNS